MDSPLPGADVLVVDDEVVICKGIQRVLSSLGAKVDFANNGLEGLQRLREQPYDVAIIDMVMPSLGGMELLEKMQEEGIEAVPMVITAHASIETALEAVRRGAFDYLPKPFVPDELILRVERAVRWRRLREDAERMLLEVATDKTQLGTIVESLADGVIVVNRQGRVVLMNPAARMMLAVDDGAEALPPVEHVISDRGLLELIRAVAEETGESRPVYTTRLQAGGRDYMARVVPIVKSDGELVGSATVLRDVTELMSLERAKSQFMSMVAHELKAPLAAVQGYLKVILSQELPADKLRQIVERSSDRVEGMAQLVRDLLDLSRADAMPARRIEPLDLREVLGALVELIQPLAERAHVSIETAVAPDVPAVWADLDDLKTILGNLITNAVKYNREGGSVTVAVRRAGDQVQVDVTDTGIGIPPEAVQRLGEEFFRVDSPERRGIVGTGLGLALVRKALDFYHGRIAVRSEPGKGSTFTVWLPVRSV